jgi:hypothetical protein
MWRSSTPRIGAPTQLGRCTPLVTWVIGTASAARPGHSPRHISRATAPWRRLTPFAERLIRKLNVVMPNGSAPSSGW